MPVEGICMRHLLVALSRVHVSVYLVVLRAPSCTPQAWAPGNYSLNYSKQ